MSIILFLLLFLSNYALVIIVELFIYCDSAALAAVCSVWDEKKEKKKKKVIHASKKTKVGTRKDELSIQILATKVVVYWHARILKVNYYKFINRWNKDINFAILILNRANKKGNFFTLVPLFFLSLSFLIKQVMAWNLSLASSTEVVVCTMYLRSSIGQIEQSVWRYKTGSPWFTENYSFLSFFKSGVLQHRPIFQQSLEDFLSESSCSS